ncbi:DEAD/DEAH box helicase [Paenibacillus sp.]|uniref:DEAD/DEAH box helicase n=1 Tax=Paenibacillus sp. TaxID=58172 RepID=UPI002D38287E|nr:DEAD/DEAH box helicase [Paenibacillus sp.]HZG84665.1 DEAD/DEAH box helicase [Paenibacillus sp.]
MNEIETNEKGGFAALGIQGPWLAKLEARGIVEPSPIQAAALPALLGGGDAVIRSRTGTGKTLAFLLPALERIDAASDALQVVVLTPTAELAMQIAREAGDLTEGTTLRTQALIGGASLQRQLDKLKQKPQLVVGTPGRILEIMALKKLKTTEVKYVVVDEADQTFALGAGGEAERILGALPASKQTVFCSATMPEEASRVAAKWTKNAVRVEAEPPEEAGLRLPPTVEHSYIVTEERDRIDAVRRLLRTVQPRSAILFVNQTESIAEVEAKLQYHGLAVEAVYGEQPKQERTAVMRRFRSGKLKLLLATDVAARGLDAPDVTHVIHVDPPLDAERYLHRAGRTGRMGRSGESILVLTPNRTFIAAKFADALGIAIREKRLKEGAWQPAAGNGASPRKQGRPAPSADTAKAAVSGAAKAPASGAAKPASVSAGKGAATNGANGAAVSASRGASANGAKAAPKPKAQTSAAAAAAKKAENRHRDKKNKGAPRWLKEKRAAASANGHANASPTDGSPRG